MWTSTVTLAAPGAWKATIYQAGRVDTTRTFNKKEEADAWVANEVASRNAATPGRHIGPITQINGRLVAQKTGRDPSILAWHYIERLQGPVPDVDQIIEIWYRDGIGHVDEQGIGQGIER